MKLQNFAVAVLALACVFLSSKSYAILDLDFVGGITQMTESISASNQTYTNTANVGRSYGAMVNIYSGTGWGLGVGALYEEVNFNSTITTGGVVVANTNGLVPYYVMPVTANYWIGSVLSLGGGVYYAIPGGNVNVLGTTGSFSQQNYRGDDYGLDAKAEIRIPLGIVTHLSATAIYQYGIENVSTTSGTSIHNQGFIFLAGFGFGL